MTWQPTCSIFPESEAFEPDLEGMNDEERCGRPAESYAVLMHEPFIGFVCEEHYDQAADDPDVLTMGPIQEMRDLAEIA